MQQVFDQDDKPRTQIRPGPERTVEVRFDKRTHKWSIPRELETEEEVSIVIEPKLDAEAG